MISILALVEDSPYPVDEDKLGQLCVGVEDAAVGIHDLPSAKLVHQPLNAVI